MTSRSGGASWVVLLVGLVATAAAPLASSRPESPSASAGLGLFEAQADVGQVRQPGSVRFDAERGSYRMSGSGANMWASRDAFHFAWRRESGDLTLTTAVAFEEKAGNEHRKAGWIVRQGLEADAPYADAIVHAEGLV